MAELRERMAQSCQEAAIFINRFTDEELFEVLSGFYVLGFEALITTYTNVAVASAYEALEKSKIPKKAHQDLLDSVRFKFLMGANYHLLHAFGQGQWGDMSRYFKDAHQTIIQEVLAE
jgi:hypothetical protein